MASCAPRTEDPLIRAAKAALPVSGASYTGTPRVLSLNIDAPVGTVEVQSPRLNAGLDQLAAGLMKDGQASSGNAPSGSVKCGRYEHLTWATADGEAQFRDRISAAGWKRTILSAEGVAEQGVLQKNSVTVLYAETRADTGRWLGLCTLTRTGG